MIVLAWCSQTSAVWGVRQVIAGLQNFDAQKVAAVVIAAEKVSPSFDQIAVNHRVLSVRQEIIIKNSSRVILTLVENSLNPVWKPHSGNNFLS